MPQPILWPIIRSRTRPGQVGGVPPWMAQAPLAGTANQYLTIFGVTKTGAGAILPSCAVKLFRTEDDVEVAEVVSDAVSGAYEFRGVAPSRTYYLVAYKAGSPDVAGTTTNTLIGTTPGLGAFLTYAQTILADNPVAYWRLGEASGTFADSAGTNTATETGTVTRDVANPSLSSDDGAVDFPTTSDYLTAPDATALDLGDGPFTIEMWAKRTTDSGLGETALDKGIGAYVVGVRAAQDTFRLALGGGAALFSSTGVVPANGTWHHYVITRSAVGTGNTKVYVDAVDDTLEITPATALGNSADVLAIGHGTIPDRWNGALDEIAIYKSVLTAAQVANHYARR